jgi:peptide/nickel transport system substrate-binding protein
MPDYFTLVRYDGYYGEKAGIKNINCINYNNSADAMATAIMNGDLDFVNRTAVADAMIADSIVAMNPNAVVMGNAGHGQRCWFFNLGDRADGKMKADLQKKEVRQAFDILMDQDAIAELVGATGTGTFVKKGAPGYCPEYDRAYDVAAAKALLDAAGFDYSQTYDFAYYYDEALVHDAHALIVQLFGAAGVKVNPILLSGGNLADLLYVDCNYDLIMLMAGGNDQMPAKGYEKLTSATSYTFMGKHEERGTTAGWDALWAEYNAEADFNKRVEIGKKMQAKNYDECYMLSGYATALYSAWDASRVYIPEDQFIYGGNAYDFSQWKMLV